MEKLYSIYQWIVGQINHMRTIEVTDPNPAWKTAFTEEAARLRAALGSPVIDIQHIGSTAIPAIKAKPVVDMLLVVSHIESLDPFEETMRGLGYLPKGEYGIPGRRFYIKGSEEQRSHHLHAFGLGNPHIGRHLRFRDYLTAHPAEAQQYSQLKARLAAQFPHDIEAYMDGKHDLIQDLDRRALAWVEGRMLLPEIETPRLTLRALSPRQLEWALHDLPQLEAGLGMPVLPEITDPPVKRAISIKLYKMALAQPERYAWYTYFLIIPKDQPAGAGTIGFKGEPNAQGMVEVGYGIDPLYRRLGYTSEALRALIDWAFAQAGCRAITATGVLPENAASQGVLGKCGFSFTGQDEHGLNYILHKQG